MKLGNYEINVVKTEKIEKTEEEKKMTKVSLRKKIFIGMGLAGAAALGVIALGMGKKENQTEEGSTDEDDDEDYDDYDDEDDDESTEEVEEVTGSTEE
jgi:hypothetical protein